jgi:hypothetical protein
MATVEVTSEDPDFPIESAFGSNRDAGWRASQRGDQLIRLIFDRPISVRRIQLHFREAELERTHEFTVRWSSVGGGVMNEIVRQQWNFSPTGSTGEVEDYQVSLDDVSVMELAIKPDLGRQEALATLSRWRLA